MVARAAESGLGETQRALLAAAQQVILHSDIDSLSPIFPDELAKHLQQPELRRQLIQGMVVMSLVEGPSSSDQAKLITTFASAMQADEPAVDVIRHLAEKKLLMFRLDFYRRSHLRAAIESTYRTRGGLIGLAKSLQRVAGRYGARSSLRRLRQASRRDRGTRGAQLLPCEWIRVSR